MQEGMLNRMPSTSVRVDRETHEELKRLARELGTTVGEAVAIAARRLRQQRIGKELSTPLTRDEVDWLDADLG
jgi:antitoxin component of RelBE/YafQ-DinJ toxin-antitoxin module